MASCLDFFAPIDSADIDFDSVKIVRHLGLLRLAIDLMDLSTSMGIVEMFLPTYFPAAMRILSVTHLPQAVEMVMQVKWP